MSVLLSLSKLMFTSLKSLINLYVYFQLFLITGGKNVCGDEKDSEANQGDENTCHSKMAMVEVEMRCAKRGTTYVTSCPSKWKCGGIR